MRTTTTIYTKYPAQPSALSFSSVPSQPNFAVKVANLESVAVDTTIDAPAKKGEQIGLEIGECACAWKEMGKGEGAAEELHGRRGLRKAAYSSREV